MVIKVAEFEATLGEIFGIVLKFEKAEVFNDFKIFKLIFNELCHFSRGLPQPHDQLTTFNFFTPFTSTRKHLKMEASTD